MRANLAVRQATFLDLLDDEGARDVEKVCSLDGAELLLGGHQGNGAALADGSEQLTDQLQSGRRQLDRRVATVGGGQGKGRSTNHASRAARAFIALATMKTACQSPSADTSTLDSGTSRAAAPLAV